MCILWHLCVDLEYLMYIRLTEPGYWCAKLEGFKVREAEAIEENVIYLSL